MLALRQRQPESQAEEAELRSGQTCLAPLGSRGPLQPAVAVPTVVATAAVVAPRVVAVATVAVATVAILLRAATAAVARRDLCSACLRLLRARYPSSSSRRGNGLPLPPLATAALSLPMIIRLQCRKRRRPRAGVCALPGQQQRPLGTRITATVTTVTAGMVRATTTTRSRMRPQWPTL